MAVILLFIALALVAICLVLTAIRMVRLAPGTATPGTATESNHERASDDDITEVRRGDRPDPPAAPSDSNPDNVAPIQRPGSGDERR